MTSDKKDPAREVPGIELDTITDWLSANLKGYTPPYQFRLITGGRSNLTYLITDKEGRNFILRRPPVSHVLKTAHDMSREYRVIKALNSTDIPTPKALAYCDDPSVTGATFYIMEFVEGAIIRDAHEAQKSLPTKELRKEAGEDLVRVLAKLHNLDPGEIGLSDFGKYDGYIQRQLNRWWQQFEASLDPEDPSEPPVRAAYEKLIGNIPEQQKTSIAHGDYRLDNCVIGSDGKVAAILDWEISTLGDPLADLGLLMVYWAEKGDNNPLLSLAATSLDGFPTRKEMIRHYANYSELDLSGLNYYIAFGYWKLACILQGVFNRYRKGAHPGDPINYSGFGDQVIILANSALAHLGEL